MAKIKINGLVEKPTASGPRWYWQPSATLKAAGWKALPLGADRAKAIAAAEAKNREVAVWRAGGAKPREVKKILVRATVEHVIAEFKKHRFPRLKENTQSEYASKLKVIARWAGSERMDAITRANVLQFRDALYAPRKDGRVHENTAFNTLKVLRNLFDWAQNNEHVPRGYAAIRDAAIETSKAAGDVDLAGDLALLQFRDFRRTCVVTMGQRALPDYLIASITGHRLETTKKILETYLPRTTGHAMLATDLMHARAPVENSRKRSGG